MEVYVARQPILDTKCEVVAYELLYRGSEANNYFPQVDGDEATAEVVVNGFFNMGIEQISEGKSCFVNFTENLLKSELPLCFPPETLVIELLENIEPTEELIKICTKLKSKGYRIALDDYVIDPDNPYTFQLLECADIIKIDLLATNLETVDGWMDYLRDYDLEWLAEKVETYDIYQQCLKKGFSYFQGYFFSKPVILTSYDMSVYPFQHMELIKELSKDEPDVSSIARKIQMDVALSVKLLQLINSSTYRRMEPIKSIEQAIVLLGFQEVRKWAYVLTIKEIKAKNGKIPHEVIKVSFMRAKMGELIARQIGQVQEGSSYFLTGILSLIDTFMQRPIENILEDLPLHNEIKSALLGEQNKYRKVLDLCKLVERAEWEEIHIAAKKLGLSLECLFGFYNESVAWTQTLLENFYTPIEVENQRYK